MNSKAKYSTLTAIALITATVSLHAQGGCFESPEAPTDVLLLAGAASMFYGPAAVRKILSKIRSRN